MSDEEYGLPFGQTSDGSVENVSGHTSVHSAERIVQQQNGAIAVERTSQAHSLTLTATQVCPPLSNLRRRKKNQKQCLNYKFYSSKLLKKKILIFKQTPLSCLHTEVQPDPGEDNRLPGRRCI